jgi:hypothetical protein
MLALSVTLLAACGGGGGSSQQPPPPPPAAASLSYSSAAQTFVVGTAITPVTATMTGTLSGFSAAPALPAGLSLDSSNGTISGTPTAIAAGTSYKISAMVAGSTPVSASVSITVNDVAPSSVAYAASKFTFSTKVDSSRLKPTASGGAVVSWSISPALPAGLDFSTSDGSISGTPTATSAPQSYTITAQNTGGQSSASLTIEVDGPPLLNLGHQTSLIALRVTATNLLSVDLMGGWILWDYASASVLAHGQSGCPEDFSSSCVSSPPIALAGTTAAIAIPGAIEVHSTSDGHELGSIATTGSRAMPGGPTTAVSWWTLASDGSYLVTASQAALTAWSPSGQKLFSRAGDYSQAFALATPGAVLVGLGAAAQDKVETISVPGDVSSLSPAFNGQFTSWFPDGSRFISTAGSTVLVYSKDAIQQGSLTSLPAGRQATGQGNWMWAYSNTGNTLNVYPANQSDPAPTAMFAIPPLSAGVASGTAVAVFNPTSNAVSIIDLSGATPTKTDFTTPRQSGFGFAAVSASQWVTGTLYGMILDGASAATATPRYFGYGEAFSVVGGTGRFAVATASGAILTFDSNTLAPEGTPIDFAAHKLALSADGSVLVAQGAGQEYGVYSTNVYSLPGGSLQYTWPYTFSGGVGVATQDITLSGSGTVLGQSLYTSTGLNTPASSTEQVGPPTGGSPIYSKTVATLAFGDDAMPMRLSPDGTLFATSQLGSVTDENIPPGTNFFRNGTFITAIAAWPVGWLDNSRLLVNEYTLNNHGSVPVMMYSRCSLYGPDGVATGQACALPLELQDIQPVSTDIVYEPHTNFMYSVSSGKASWHSGDAPGLQRFPPTGAVAGSNVIFVSGTDLLAQGY